MNKEVKPIFIVTQGDYSSYHICAVFSERRLAELFVARYEVSEFDVKAEIEEWGLNLEVPTLAEGDRFFYVEMARDGTVGELRLSEENHFRANKLGIGQGPYENMILGEVLARDAQHAIKIANEFRSQAIAIGKLAP